MQDDLDGRGRRDEAASHPLRRAMLGVLAEGRRLPATALCHELPESPSLSVVHYHLSVLVDAGLVERIEDPTARPVYARAA